MTERYYPDREKESRDLRNVVTGLILFFVSILCAATLIFINAQNIAKALPFSAEQRFIRPYEQMIRHFNEDNELPPRHAEISAYLVDLSEALSTEMDLPEDHTLSIHYVDSDMVNAFAMLGGHVFITRGLLAALESENSLSMVLAHEIAHVKHRDPLAGVGRGLALQLIFSFVTGQSSSGSTIAASGGQLGLLHFSREQETDADVAAMHAIHGVYGHVADAGGLFELLIEDSSVEHNESSNTRMQEVEETLQGWLSTHPVLADRLDAMNALAEEKNWPTQGDVTPLPAWLKQAVAAQASTELDQVFRKAL